MSGDPEKFRELMAEADRIGAELDAILPDLAAARAKYFKTRAEADQRELDRIQEIASATMRRYSALQPQLRAATGLTVDELEALLERPKPTEAGVDRVPRSALTVDRVKTTALMDELLPEALRSLEALCPPGWLEGQADVDHQLTDLADGTAPLSLIKGLRPASELTPLHRFRQMLRCARDFLKADAGYDHFAGATLLPQLAQLGSRLGYLNEVGGNVQDRLDRLHQGPSEQVDSVVFELLVAEALAEKGRRIEFIGETFDPTPDFRCYDPFPMFIECKRKRALSDYDLREEREMRAVYDELHKLCAGSRLHGLFSLHLSREVFDVRPSDIATVLYRQRLAAHPERPLVYDWGTVSFEEKPRTVTLPSSTKMYSPNMLRYVFGWNSDLPDWDGIICQVSGDGDQVVDTVSDPLALQWNNTSHVALRKRAWSPVDLVGSAMKQIPAGEFGMMYLCYHEGARENVADRRVQDFMERLGEWDHSSNIRVPLALLVRLYPRALGQGQPDLIESNLRFVSEAYGEPEMFSMFPQSLFTPSGQARRSNRYG